MSRTIAFAALLCVLLPVAATAEGTPELVVIRSIRHDTSPPLADMAIPVPGMKFGSLGDINPIQVSPQFLDPKKGDHPPTADVQLLTSPTEPTGPTVPTFLSIPGLANEQNPFFLSPPDTEGDVGPNHYFQWVNLIWAVWNKSGTLLSGPNLGNSFFQGFGGPCETTNQGDPVVLHDDAADRWFVTQFVAQGASAGAQCFAVSTSPNPLGSYFRYQFQIEVGGNPDYPKFGVWSEESATAGSAATSQSAYTYTYRNFAASPGFNNYGVFERDAMLVGASAEAVIFRNPCTADDCLEGGLPPHLDGPSVPFGTCPTFFSIVDDEFDASPWTVDGVRNHTLCVDWNTPTNSTLVENPIVPGDEIDRADGNGFSSCVQTPGVSVGCLTLFTMYRAQVRNLGSELSVVLNSSVNSGAGRTGIYWLEMRESLVDTSQGWTMRQDSTYSPNDGLERWMGSVAQNGQGDIYLGYTASNSTNNPSIRYTSRAAGDPLGTLPGGEQICRSGAGAPTTTGRWGDYSTESVDPSDDCSFWQTHMYYDQGTARWLTRVCAANPCAPSVAPTITQTGGACPGAVTVQGTGFSPNKEVALIGAANLNGFIKGGTLCNGAAFEIGEPFALPPTLVFTDGNGDFSTSISTTSGRCFVEALDLTGSCQTSNAIATD